MTTSDPSAAATYLRTRVMTARPEELRMMLLDGALRFARQGREGLERRDYEASFTGLSQCQDIVMELATSIRADQDRALAERVRGLYLFLYQELVQASVERDIDRVDGVIRLLEYERETWAMLLAKLAAERSGQAAHKAEAAVEAAARSISLSA
ncbi:MAG TPA: flagellar export chaperone FliS [Phycisphaerales bacterium]|nr:flagellar export chaperone FliS [Phycisphaerales bacterium]